MIDVALLGRLEACLDVESLLLEEDRGRDERLVRRVDLCDGEGCEEWRPVVCQVSWIQIDDVGTGIDGEIVDVILGLHQVDGDGL